MNCLDLIIKGNVVTMVNQKPRAKAIGVKDGRIAVVGGVEEMEKIAGDTTQILDLKDKTILPGFIDSHTHLTATGISMLGVDLSSVTSVNGALERIRERVQITPAGKGILCWEFDSFKVKEKRFPSQEELNAISTEHPISVQHYDLHFAMLNSAAFKLAGFTADEEGVVTDSSGQTTGLVEDPAIFKSVRMMGEAIREENHMKALLAVAKAALKVGITTVHAKDPLDDALYIINNQDQIPVRVKTLIMGEIKEDGLLDKVLSSGIPGERVCIAIIADGSIEGHTGALFEPYSDDPDALGMLYYTDNELHGFVEKAHRAGMQVSIHAETDRSIEQAISVYEKVLAEYPREDHRHRIEHFEFPLGEHITRVARAGVTLGMQPAFLSINENVEHYRKLFGELRIKRCNPYRFILDQGILVSGGSDSPVTRLNPLKGIYDCLTHPLEEQRIELYEALKMFTINGAKIGFEEKLKGSIEPGKLADFAVLSKDPNRVAYDQINNIEVEMTIVGGEIVFEKGMN
jgi:predicted amidohydrolase YtcJ